MSTFTENLMRQNLWFLSAVLLFAVCSALYGWVAARSSRSGLLKLASILFVGATLAVTAFIGLRWQQADRPPFKSLYESLILFVWCMAVLYAAVERFWRIAWLGAAASVGAVAVLGYAVAKNDAEIINLPAALQSVWFVPHVVVYFFGYAAVFLAFVAALLHLWRPAAVVTLQSAAGGQTTMTFAGFMHKTILLAFILLTAGLVMGSIWAKSAWGDYWVWDPKENWALVSWLVFAVYLHLRLTKGFTERAAAVLTILGFAAIGFTYLGMHLLPTAEQSAHVYQ